MYRSYRLVYGQDIILPEKKSMSLCQHIVKYIMTFQHAQHAQREVNTLLSSSGRDHHEICQHVSPPWKRFLHSVKVSTVVETFLVFSLSWTTETEINAPKNCY